MSSGIILIFGVIHIMNLTHSAFIAMAAYQILWEFKTIILDPTLFIAITMPAVIWVGKAYCKVLSFPRAVYPRITDISVLITFATALVIEGVLALIFTGIYRTIAPEYAKASFNFGSFFIPQNHFCALIIFFLIIGLCIFLWCSLIGNAIKASMQNLNVVQAIGVNVCIVPPNTTGNETRVLYQHPWIGIKVSLDQAG
jgi:branched-chain amino acid transport system permease protein